MDDKDVKKDGSSKYATKLFDTVIFFVTFIGLLSGILSYKINKCIGIVIIIASIFIAIIISGFVEIIKLLTSINNKL